MFFIDYSNCFSYKPGVNMTYSDGCVCVYNSKNEIGHSNPYFRFILSPNKTIFYNEPHSKMILSDIYYLYDIKTIKKFNLKITDYQVLDLFKFGHIEVLEWLKKSNMLFLSLRRKNIYMDIASEYGHVDILEWMKNSGLPLKYSDKAFINASKNGHVNVLEWWKNSGLHLKYSSGSNFCNSALGLASKEGHVDVLNWWKNSGLLLQYDIDVLDWISTYGHINVLDWWFNSGLPLISL